MKFNADIQGAMVQAKMISMTDAMSSRVGIDQSVGREILSTESKMAFDENRQMDMAFVARAIKRVSERL